MSTDLDAPARRRMPRRGLAPLLLIASFACAPHASANLADLCKGSPVHRTVTLVLDTVLTPGSALQALEGQRYAMTLRLVPHRPPGTCGDATGQASYDADLPDELAGGISQTVSPTWLVLGTEVVVDFNPTMAKERLEMRLPLDGSTGHWTLAGPAGQEARGRVLKS